MVNEIIREWAGDNLFDGRRSSVIKPFYDSDPAAWTPELYQKMIEDDKAKRFTEVLEQISKRPCSPQIAIKFRLVSSTPLQKANALARVIENGHMEVKDAG